MNTRSSKISGGCFLYFVVVVLVSITGHQAGNVYVIAAKPISTTTATSLTSVIIKRRPSSTLKTKTKTTHELTHDATPTRVASVEFNTATSSEAVEEDKDDSSSSGIYVDKPILRGQFHKYGAILYPFLFGLPLYFRAISKSASAASATSPSTTNSNNLLVLSTILFNLAIESIMIISATLHTYKWKSNYWHLFTRKLDFTAIFVGIALIYSSLGKLLLGNHPLYFVLELVVWISAIAGTIMKWFIPDCPHYFNGLIFMVQGWAGLPLVPTLFRTCHIREAMSIFSGGIFITLGAVAYSFQWPKPKLHVQQQRDIIFGPHELFHVSSLLMFLSMWYTMWFNISCTTSI
jgi:channel protein (hemolysin III family)